MWSLYFQSWGVSQYVCSACMRVWEYPKISVKLQTQSCFWGEGVRCPIGHRLAATVALNHVGLVRVRQGPGEGWVSTGRQQEGFWGGGWGLTWTNSRVVARSLLSQWPTTLGAVGGGHTETSATLPALPTCGRTHTPRWPLLTWSWVYWGGRDG